MESKIERITKIAEENDLEGIVQMLRTGLDPNFEGGWPLRLAARKGSYSVVKTLLQFGANPHLHDRAGASTLQLAVYSGQHWEDGSWEPLLSSCDSSQLADGAAVAIVFRQTPALRQVIRTGRCNTNVPTTLTGRTVEGLAKCYNMEHVLQEAPMPSNIIKLPQFCTPAGRRLRDELVSPRDGEAGRHRVLHYARSLSPSVANFFEQTARLSPQHVAVTPFPSLSASPSPGSPMIFISSPSTPLE